MRIGVVDALDRDLPNVGAEELPRQALRVFALQPVIGRHLFAVDPLEHENLLGHVRMNHLRHQQLGEIGDHAADELGVVRLLGQVELAVQVHLQLVRERLEL